jgi:hypothetical protein
VLLALAGIILVRRRRRPRGLTREQGGSFRGEPVEVALEVIPVEVEPEVEPEPVRVLADAAAPPSTISGDVDPIAALDALLAELETATVRIDGSDELDESAVVELERLADKLEAAAAGLERVG